MPSPEQIDAILPQTQCGLCGFKGCMPYAEALAKQQAEINLCPPGGVPGLLSLAELLEQDATPFLAEMTQKAKPDLVAVIREAECIGCTKCIQACPVDAILGGAKQMHSVIANECTGCELCVAPCPVDCIDMRVVTDQQKNPEHYRKRYYAREQRLQNKAVTSQSNLPEDNKKSYIEAAILRANTKRQKG
jgi:electron transport complex protein RnfB